MNLLSKLKANVKSKAQEVVQKASPVVQEKISQFTQQKKDDILQEILSTSGKILLVGACAWGTYCLLGGRTASVLTHSGDILKSTSAEAGVRISCRTYNEVHNTYNYYGGMTNEGNDKGNC